MVQARSARHGGAMSEYITHPVHDGEPKRLERSSSDRFLAGVCGGLGAYFDLKPAVFRLGFVVLALLGGAGFLIYLTAALVLPAQGKEDSIAARAIADRREHPARLVGLGLVAAAVAVLLSSADSWPTAGAGWVVVLFAGLVVLWAGGKSRPRKVVFALGAFVATVVLVASAAVVLAFSWFDVSLSDGTGDRVYRPTSRADLEQVYKLGIGALELDLTNLTADGPVRVRAELGMGELRILVPQAAAVQVDASATFGDLKVLGRHEEGHNPRIVTGLGTVPSSTITIDAEVGAGEITVERAG